MEAAQQSQNHEKNGSNSKRQNQSQSTPWFVYGLSALAAVGGFLFGYDTGVVSGAMLLLKPAFGLSSEWQVRNLAIFKLQILRQIFARGIFAKLT